MTTSDPTCTCPVLTAAEAIETATALAAEFAPGAAERDRNRQLPFGEMERLSGSGLLAITVPVEHGGADLLPSVVAEVIRILSAAGTRMSARSRTATSST